MLDLGWTEIMLIAAVAVLVISPKDLPRTMRTVGKWVGDMKRMARGFQNQFNQAIREAELDDVKKSVEAVAKVNPVADIKKQLTKVDTDIRAEMKAQDEKIKSAMAGDEPAKTIAAPAADTATADAPATEAPAPETASSGAEPAGEGAKA